MSTHKFTPYAMQHISLEDRQAVNEALMGGVITRGGTVSLFEESVASYCGAKYAVAFNSGASALAATYDAAETTSNDTLITTPNTFIATAGPAIKLGATPVFIDIDRKTGNIDQESLMENMNRNYSRGKTIIAPVHFSGIPVDMEAIDQAITDYRTVIIEDAAHAIGSCYKDGTRVGNCQWSHMTIFSFHPAKTLTTGEGGMVTTNDEQLYNRLRLFRNNGIENNPLYLKKEERPGYYEVNFLSGNYHLTDFQAALGLSQLKRIDTFIAKRQTLMEYYRKKLAEFKHVRLFAPNEKLFIAHHLCVVQIDFSAYKTTKKAVMEKLQAQHIGTQVHYIPIYRHPFFFDKVGDLSPYFPNMENYYKEALSLPLYYDLNEEDIDRIVLSLKRCLI